jgi:hypothetical protein
MKPIVVAPSILAADLRRLGDEVCAVVARAQAGDQTLPAAVGHPVSLLHWITDRAAAPERAN